MKLMNLALAALFFFLASPASGQPLPLIGYCDGCSSAGQWESTAESASIGTYPIFNGSHDVYLLDRDSITVRAFSVRRWYENGGIIPNTAGSSEERSSQFRLAGYYHADATEVPADFVIQQAIVDGFYAVRDVIDEFKDGPIPIEDLGLLPQIPSAIDLVGPNDSDAGLNRNALANRLSVYANGRINDAALTLYDLAQRAVSQLLSDSMINAVSTFLISFPDGTSIEVRLEGIYEVATGGDISFTLDVTVLQSTASGAGLAAIPVSGGQFANFSFSGDGNVVAALIRLAHRYGIPVNSGGGSGGGGFVCEIEGSQIRCRVTNSGN